MSDAVSCGSGGGDDSSLGLRIGSVFIILVGSMTGALFPVLAKRSSWLHVPKPIFEFVLGSFLIFMVIYDHIASQNSLVRESLYGRRLFRVGKFCLTFFSPGRLPQRLSIFSLLVYRNCQVHVCLRIGRYM